MTFPRSIPMIPMIPTLFLPSIKRPDEFVPSAVGPRVWTSGGPRPKKQLPRRVRRVAGGCPHGPPEARRSAARPPGHVCAEPSLCGGMHVLHVLRKIRTGASRDGLTHSYLLMVGVAP